MASKPTMKSSNTSAITHLLGDEIASKEGRMLRPADLSSRFVGLYFSAHWCPPCQAFTPKLADFYQKFKKEHQHASHLEIVFVSSDKSEDDAMAYHQNMPWPMLPYQDRPRKAALSKRYKVCFQLDVGSSYQ
jgi:nucleoredoxin